MAWKNTKKKPLKIIGDWGRGKRGDCHCDIKIIKTVDVTFKKKNQKMEERMQLMLEGAMSLQLENISSKKYGSGKIREIFLTEFSNMVGE